MFVIIGMHRSGTSLVGQLLKEAGLTLTDTLVPNESNPRGYCEDGRVMMINEQLLGSWDNPGKVPFRVVKYFFGDDVVKDPRFCLTYHAWVFPDHQVIKVKRNREAVVRSLRVRDGFTKKKARRLYKIYNDAMDKIPGPVFRYEDLLKDVGPLSEFVGLELNQSVADRKLNHEPGRR